LRSFDQQSAINSPQSNNDGLATGFLDLGLGGLGKLRGRYGKRACEFAVTEDLQIFFVVTDQAGVRQNLGVHFRDTGIESGKIAQVDDHRLNPERSLVETAVREFTIKGHLATFETGTDAAAGTGRLALAAATGGLAVATAFATAYALLAVDGTGNVLEFVEFHIGS
jgi:hypothetical protein